jgi:hypothetical protein
MLSGMLRQAAMHLVATWEVNRISLSLLFVAHKQLATIDFPFLAYFPEVYPDIEKLFRNRCQI